MRKIIKIFLFSLVFGTVLVFPRNSLAATITSRSLALKLITKAENGAGYVRTAFPLWIDADKDGCDTRKEVLIAESKVKPVLSTGCKVVSGKWVSWYDGKTWTNPADVDIDHVVPLKEAWDSGARSWTKAVRTSYANDLLFSWSLDAVTDNVNSSKGDRDPAQWLPPLASARCAYASHWVAIKYRWQLTVDTAEQKKLLSILTGDCGSRKLTVPTLIKTSAQTFTNANTDSNIPIVTPIPIVVTPAPITTNTNTAAPVPNTSNCCKVCTTGQACGDSCISRSYTCSKPPGCACQG